MTTTTTATITTPAEYAAAVQEIKAAYFAETYPMLDAPRFYAAKGGRKFTRIVEDNGTQRFVHCFINNETGAVHKAEGWKAASPRPRYSSMDTAIIACARNNGGIGYTYVDYPA
jgi:hypothetical protein